MRKPGAVFLPLLLGVCCASSGSGVEGTPCPVDWAPSHSIDEATASLRARVQLQMGEQGICLEMIAQDRSNAFVVAGLAQYGMRLFALHQRDGKLAVQDASTREREQTDG